MTEARLWASLLSSGLFFLGVAQGGVAFAAIYRVSKGRWGPGVERLGLSGAGFLPVGSLVVLATVVLGGDVLYPWARHAFEGRVTWLSIPFVVARAAAATGLLALLSIRYARIHALRDDPRRDERLDRLAPWLLLAYALLWTLLAFDLLMSLEPPWTSTLFGAYVFIGNLYAGLAAIAVAAAFARGAAAVEVKASHDLGKLLFAFSAVAGDFLWSQYAVIWYGNIPEETAYLARRVDAAPWGGLARTVLVVAFVLPFVLLLFRGVKRRPAALAAVGATVLVGMLLERHLLVLPAVLPAQPGAAFTGIEAAVAAALALLYAGFIRRGIRRAE